MSLWPLSRCLATGRPTIATPTSVESQATPRENLCPRGGWWWRCHWATNSHACANETGTMCMTLEVTRTATDGTPNANSMLYGAAWRAAKALGYDRVITYTQAGESGTSLRAAGWAVIAERAPRPGWDVPSRPRETKNANVQRYLWEVAA